MKSIVNILSILGPVVEPDLIALSLAVERELMALGLATELVEIL